MGLENDPGLHDMEVVDSRRVDVRQDFGEKVRLLLIVALETDPVAGTDNCLKQRLHILRWDHFAAGEAGRRRETVMSRATLLLPVSDVAVTVWLRHCLIQCFGQGKYSCAELIDLGSRCDPQKLEKRYLVAVVLGSSFCNMMVFR